MGGVHSQGGKGGGKIERTRGPLNRGKGKNTFYHSNQERGVCPRADPRDRRSPTFKQNTPGAGRKTAISREPEGLTWGGGLELVAEEKSDRNSPVCKKQEKAGKRGRDKKRCFEYPAHKERNFKTNTKKTTKGRRKREKMGGEKGQRELTASEAQ